MIKKLFLIFSFAQCAVSSVNASEISHHVEDNSVQPSNIQRFSLYAALYLDQMETPKKAYFARFKADDTSDADFELVTDNALLANLIEIIEVMTYDELHNSVIMHYLKQILECKNLENESTIQHRKAYIIELLKEKKLI